MAVKYVFVEKDTGAVFRQREDELFASDEGNVANEAMLSSLSCGETPTFAMLNAYKILQPTFEFNTGDIFASSVQAPDVYCLIEAVYYTPTVRCLTVEDVSNEDWFEQVDYIDEYL